MNLPNKLTLLRIGLIPIFVLAILIPQNFAVLHVLHSSLPLGRILAMLIFTVASITDFLDGYLARRDHLVTNFGKFADPLADKMLVMVAFICLVDLHLVPAVVVAIIVCRELAVTGLRLLLVQDGEVMAAAWPGKVKTATQMLAIIFLLLDDFPLKQLGFPIGNIFLYICLICTIYSGVDYFWKNRKVFADSF